MIKFIEKEQDWANDATRYWFDVNGEEYAVVESGGRQTIVCEGGDHVYNATLEAQLKAVLIVTDDMRRA